MCIYVDICVRVYVYIYTYIYGGGGGKAQKKEKENKIFIESKVATARHKMRHSAATDFLTLLTMKATFIHSVLSYTGTRNPLFLFK